MMNQRRKYNSVKPHNPNNPNNPSNPHTPSDSSSSSSSLRSVRGHSTTAHDPHPARPSTAALPPRGLSLPSPRCHEARTHASASGEEEEEVAPTAARADHACVSASGGAGAGAALVSRCASDPAPAAMYNHWLNRPLLSAQKSHLDSPDDPDNPDNPDNPARKRERVIELRLDINYVSGHTPRTRDNPNNPNNLDNPSIRKQLNYKYHPRYNPNNPLEASYLPSLSLSPSSRSVVVITPHAGSENKSIWDELERTRLGSRMLTCVTNNPLNSPVRNNTLANPLDSPLDSPGGAAVDYNPCHSLRIGPIGYVRSKLVLNER